MNYSSGAPFYDPLDDGWRDLDAIAAADAAGEEILLDAWVAAMDGFTVDACASTEPMHPVGNDFADGWR